MIFIIITTNKHANPFDITKKLMDPKTLFIMPQVEDKFIKFVDVGETEIYEITDKGDRISELMKYVKENGIKLDLK